MVRLILLALVTGILALAGCGSGNSSQDYSKKPDQSQPAPYVPPNHKNAFDTVNKGPTQPNPRPSTVPK